MTDPADSSPSAPPPEPANTPGRTPGFALALALALAKSLFRTSSELCYLAGTVAWRNRARILATLSLVALAVLPTIHFCDHAAIRWIESWRTKETVQLGKTLSTLGELHLAPLGIAVSLWIWTEFARRSHGRIAMGASILAMLVSGIAVQLPKFVFGRPRPFLNVPDQFGWLQPGWTSFPSGHATHWFALVGALWIFSPRISLWVAPLAVVAALARVLVSRHYPSDLLAGAFFGLVFGLCFGLAAKAINERLGRLPATLTRPSDPEGSS